MNTMQVTLSSKKRSLIEVDVNEVPGSNPGIAYTVSSTGRTLKRLKSFMWTEEEWKAWIRNKILTEALGGTKEQLTLIWSHVMVWLIRLFYYDRRKSPVFLRTSICRMWPKKYWEGMIEPWAFNEFKHGWCVWDEEARTEMNSRYFKSLAWGWYPGLENEIIISDDSQEHPVIIMVEDDDTQEVIYISDDEINMIE